MKRFIFAGITAALAIAVATASYAEQAGFQNISFNEKAAMDQVMSVISGVSLRQADRTSSQTLKEFSEWREHAENTAQPGTASSKSGKKLPPARNRRAF